MDMNADATHMFLTYNAKGDKTGLNSTVELLVLHSTYSFS